MIPVTWQQACAWYLWRDRRMVQLVGPTDNDDDNMLTVERLLEDQRKARRPPLYRWPRTIRPIHGPGFVMFPSRPGKVYGPEFAEMFPPPTGSIEAFQRAVANGQVIESEFHMFDLAELMRLFPAGNGGADADGPDPPKAELRRQFPPIEAEQPPILPAKTVRSTASYEEVKKAVEKRGPAIERELCKAAHEVLPGRTVPRAWVRKARDELFGRPGRIGRPKSSKKVATTTSRQI
jgi:hypothetical protein